MTAPAPMDHIIQIPVNRPQRSAPRMAVVLVTAISVLVTAANFWVLRQRAPVVPIETVRSAPLSLGIKTTGVVEAARVAAFKSPFEGKILTKSFREGEAVKTGQLLLEISTEHLQEDHRQRQVTLKNAEDDWKRAKREVVLQRRLFERQAVARSAVEEAERSELRAEQAYESAKLSYATAQELWNKNKLVAPFDGTVVKDGLRDDRETNRDRELVTVADLSRYRAITQVDELDAPQVRMGQKAVVTLEAYPDRALQAEVTRIGSLSDVNGLPQQPVFLDLATDPGIPPFARLSATIRLDTGNVSDRLSVPLTAIDNSDGRPSVWVVSKASRLRRRAVTLGQLTPERAEITAGLTQGDRVVAAAQADFANGATVNVVER